MTLCHREPGFRTFCRLKILDVCANAADDIIAKRWSIGGRGIRKDRGSSGGTGREEERVARRMVGGTRMKRKRRG